MQYTELKNNFINNLSDEYKKDISLLEKMGGIDNLSGMFVGELLFEEKLLNKIDSLLHDNSNYSVQTIIIETLKWVKAHHSSTTEYLMDYYKQLTNFLKNEGDIT